APGSSGRGGAGEGKAPLQRAHQALAETFELQLQAAGQDGEPPVGMGRAALGMLTHTVLAQDPERLLRALATLQRAAASPLEPAPATWLADARVLLLRLLDVDGFGGLVSALHRHGGANVARLLLLAVAAWGPLTAREAFAALQRLPTGAASAFGSGARENSKTAGKLSGTLLAGAAGSGGPGAESSADTPHVTGPASTQTGADAAADAVLEDVLQEVEDPDGLAEGCCHFLFWQDGYWRFEGAPGVVRTAGAVLRRQGEQLRERAHGEGASGEERLAVGPVLLRQAAQVVRDLAAEVSPQCHRRLAEAAFQQLVMGHAERCGVCKGCHNVGEDGCSEAVCSRRHMGMVDGEGRAAEDGRGQGIPRNLAMLLMHFTTKATTTLVPRLKQLGSPSEVIDLMGKTLESLAASPVWKALHDALPSPPLEPERHVTQPPNATSLHERHAALRKRNGMMWYGLMAPLRASRAQLSLDLSAAPVFDDPHDTLMLAACLAAPTCRATHVILSRDRVWEVLSVRQSLVYTRRVEFHLNEGMRLEIHAWRRLTEQLKRMRQQAIILELQAHSGTWSHYNWWTCCGSEDLDSRYCCRWEDRRRKQRDYVSLVHATAHM
ncbi:hypothetical protein CYMTET_52967, partial [Cymbomonas tetramitiformis]